MPQRRANPPPSPGDVFIAQIPDGRYVAVRVLRVVERSWFVATTPYLDHERPSLEDPRLREFVLQRKFDYKGGLALKWLVGRPPGNFEFLGNLPPTSGDLKKRGSDGQHKWVAESGREAWLEWRWIHDRPAFVQELREQEERAARAARARMKPKKMMDEAAFWAVIDLLDWDATGDDEKVLAPAVAALAAKTKTEIRRFEERLAFLLFQLDAKAHAMNIGQGAYDPQTGSLSVDSFLYARCVVVANGKAFYDRVRENPDAMPKDMEFEALLELAPAAYEAKTGEPFDYVAGCSYESFSNLAGWN